MHRRVITQHFDPPKTTGLWLVVENFYGLKASANSFKRFTSRLLKFSLSLSMHLCTSDGRHA